MQPELLSQYDHLLPQVQELIVAGNIETPKDRATQTTSAASQLDGMDVFASRIAVMLVGMLSRTQREGAPVPEIAGRFARMLVGVGVLQPFLEDDEVEEVMVRPGGRVFVDRAGRIEDLGQLAPEGHFYRVASFIADTRAGRALTPQYPVVLVDLQGGERFTALVPPLSPHGTIINIRRWRVRRLSLADMQVLGTFSEPGIVPQAGARPGGQGSTVAQVLVDVMRTNAASVLVSGAFSTGKTTLLNALIANLPDNIMLATAETFRELQVQHPGWAPVVVPPFLKDKEERITLAEAVNSLLTRARPDVVVLGEITSHEEAREFLRAGNLGVRAMGTIHGNSAESALVRLADLAVREGVPLRSVREQIADAVNLVVHMNRHGRQRYVAEVAWVRGSDPEGHFCLENLYRAGALAEEILARHLAPLRTGGQ
jgi:pilus assembly protein CpaF